MGLQTQSVQLSWFEYSVWSPQINSVWWGDYRLAVRHGVGFVSIELAGFEQDYIGVDLYATARSIGCAA
jgi:hypothetical protein